MTLFNNSLVFLGKKNEQYYKNIRMYADLNLHQDISNIVIKKGFKSAKILDFGCGEGALSQRLSDSGFEVISVDIEAQKFKADTHFTQLDFNDQDAVEQFVKAHENCFDIVLGIEVIEHVENHWAYVRDLKKMTKPNGFLFISTPNITSWLSRLSFLVRGQFHQFGCNDLSYGHITPVTEFHLSHILRSNELTEIEVEPVGTLPPLYFDGIKFSIISVIAILFRPFMVKGTKNGWCLLASARK